MEDDIATIHAEQEEQDQILKSHDTAFDTVISSMQVLRTLGRLDPEPVEIADARVANLLGILCLPFVMVYLGYLMLMAVWDRWRAGPPPETE